MLGPVVRELAVPPRHVQIAGEQARAGGQHPALQTGEVELVRPLPVPAVPEPGAAVDLVVGRGVVPVQRLGGAGVEPGGRLGARRCQLAPELHGAQQRGRDGPARADRRHETRGQLPADHPAGEDVRDERGIDPAGERPHVGDVSDPELIGGGGGEVPLDQVRPRLGAPAGDRGSRALGPRDPTQAVGPHQAFNGAAGRGVVPAEHLGVDLASTVDAVVLGVDPADRLQPGSIGERPR